MFDLDLFDQLSLLVQDDWQGDKIGAQTSHTLPKAMLAGCQVVQL